MDLRELYARRLRVRQVCVYLRALPPQALLVLLVKQREETAPTEFASAAELASFVANSGKAR